MTADIQAHSAPCALALRLSWGDQLVAEERVFSNGPEVVLIEGPYTLRGKTSAEGGFEVLSSSAEGGWSFVEEGSPLTSGLGPLLATAEVVRLPPPVRTSLAGELDFETLKLLLGGLVVVALFAITASQLKLRGASFVDPFVGTGAPTREERLVRMLPPPPPRAPANNVRAGDGHEAARGESPSAARKRPGRHDIASSLGDAFKGLGDNSVFQPGLGHEIGEALGGLRGAQSAELGPGDGLRGDGSLVFGDPIGFRGAVGRGPGSRAPTYRAVTWKAKERVTPRIEGESPVIAGALDRDLIRNVIRNHRAEIRYCYESLLNQNPNLAGKVVVSFLIAQTGLVRSVALEQSTARSPALESCLVEHVRRWRFPAPKGGGEVQVGYPFLFRQAGG